MKFIRPFLAALLFFVLTVYFTYYFGPTLQYLNLNPGSRIALFISSPFNMSTEGGLLYNLYVPTAIIFLLGIYLKNFNKAFQKKCNLRAVFAMGVLASYIKSVLSMQYYVGYSNYGISLGTSIITLSFLVTFVISLEVYVERKERYQHLYGHFVFALISSLIALLGLLTMASFFFETNSAIVHLMGTTAFLILFIPYYERANLRRFVRREEIAIERLEGRALRAKPA